MAIKVRTGLVNTRRVNKDNLRGWMYPSSCRYFNDARNAVARRLRFSSDDGNLLACQSVQ